VGVVEEVDGCALGGLVAKDLLGILLSSPSVDIVHVSE